jgi:hypothetical protein
VGTFSCTGKLRTPLPTSECRSPDRSGWRAYALFWAADGRLDSIDVLGQRPGGRGVELQSWGHAGAVIIPTITNKLSTNNFVFHEGTQSIIRRVTRGSTVGDSFFCRSSALCLRTILEPQRVRRYRGNAMFRFSETSRGL